MTCDKPIVVFVVKAFVTLPLLVRKSTWTVRAAVSPISPHFRGAKIMVLSLEKIGKKFSVPS